MNGEKILFRCKHGSHLYGLNTPNSDVDFKGVFLPKLEDLILGKAPNHYRTSTGPEGSKNSAGDVDETYYSLPKFIEMLCQGETIAIDMLHAMSYSDAVLEYTEEFYFIYKNREKFYTSEMKAFMGYCRKQAAKYGLKGSKIEVLERILKAIPEADGKLGDIVQELPVGEHCKQEIAEVKKQDVPVEFYTVMGSKYQLTISIDEFRELMQKKLRSFGDRARLAKENKGVDWKAISHSFRAAFQLQSIYKDGDLVYPFTGIDRDFLLDVKQGNLDFNEVQPELEAVISRVSHMAEQSSYPKKVDRGFWENYILEVYDNEYGLHLGQNKHRLEF